MANGIATPELVIAMARAGMLGFFGAAGLGLDRVEAAWRRSRRAWRPASPGDRNLIHSPHEPELEAAWSTSTCGAACGGSRPRRT